MAESIQEIVNFIWPVADQILRDDFKRGKYPDIILPFTVLRRLDCVLAGTKGKVLARHKDLQRQGIQDVDGHLHRHQPGEVLLVRSPLASEAEGAGRPIASGNHRPD